MAGIADVQPKAIQAISLPIIPATVDPATYNPPPTPDFATALSQMNAATQSVKDNEVRAATRQAALQTIPATTQAALQTIPATANAQVATANLATQDSQRQQAALDFSKEAIAKHRQYFPVIHGADGLPDNDAMEHSGVALGQAEARLAYATAGLTMHPTEFFDGPIKRTIWRNDLNENVTPNSDGTSNAVILQHQKDRREAFMDLHTSPKFPKNTPGSFAKAPDVDNGETAPPQTSLSAGAVTPLAAVPAVAPLTAEQTWAASLPAPPVVTGKASPEEATGWLLRSGAVSPANLVNMTDEEVTGAYQSMQQKLAGAPFAPARPVIAPATTTTTHSTDASGKPVVTVQTQAPSTALPMVSPAVETQSLPTGYQVGYSAPEQMKAVREGDFVKGWTGKIDTIGVFRNAANAYTDLGTDALDQKKGITNVKDLALAGAVRRLQMPGTGGGGGRGEPDYQPGKLEDYSPIIEKLYNFVPHILGKNRYDKNTRERLIAAGNRAVQAIEAPARSALQATADQFKQMNFPLKPSFNDMELGLLSSGGTPGGPANRAPVGPVQKLGSGREVQLW
jgi:hypothetical protein